MKAFALVTAAVAALALHAYGQVAVGDTAPGFSLSSHTGTTVALDSYRGKVVVLEWINMDCPFVKKHYDSGNMQSIQKKYVGKDVVWLSICSSAPGNQGHFKSGEITKRLKKSGAAQSAYLVDEKGAVGRLYGAKTTPHMFVINTSGLLEYDGAIDNTPSKDSADIKTSVNYVSAALDAVLAGTAVETKQSQPYGCSVKY